MNQELFELLFGAGIFVATVWAFGVGAAAWLLKMQSEDRRWLANAKRLGLEVGVARAGPGLSVPMVGERDGFRVTIGVRSVQHGPYDNARRVYFTYVIARFPEPLRLDATLRANRWWTRAWESVVGQRDVQLGEEELDRLYEVRAVDPGVVRELVRQAGVRDALVRHAAARFPPKVTGTEVSSEVRGKVLSLEAQAEALDAAVDLGRAVMAGHAAMGLSPGQRPVDERWRR